MMKDFIVASVGGQGGLLATTVLASVFVRAGYNVKTSEVHGMAQRGGTVTSYVRRGAKAGDPVHAPIVPAGEADAILGLEILEAYRELPNLRRGGLVVTSDERIMPVPVTMGDAAYPDLSRESFTGWAGRVHVVPAVSLAREAGNIRTSNVVCLGVLSTYLDVPTDLWEQEIARLMPAKTVEVNLKAFAIGRAAAEKLEKAPA